MAENKKYKVGVYVRLSIKDDGAGTSDSILNQEKMIKAFIDESDDLELYDTYIDDDYTGLNFNRPDFKRMISDLEKGKINCIIVKEISRFGRDYIGVGRYIEELLPSMNCRFISLIDGLDSIKTDVNTNLLIRLKNLINDNNSQDTSIKVRTIKDMLRHDGKFIGPFAPYGYIKDPDNKHKMIIDEETAPVVRDIFDWYLRGLGAIKIARKLNELGVLSRSDYKRKIGKYSDNPSKKTLWTTNAISQILKNKAYIGILEQKKHTSRNYKDKRKIVNPEENRIYTYDAHEPIISKETFDAVQDRLSKKRNDLREKDPKQNLFSGYLKCYDCKYAMIKNITAPKGKKYIYYKCRSYNQRGGIRACVSSHSLKFETIYDAVLEQINKKAKKYKYIQNIISDYKNNNSKKDITDKISKAIASKNRQIKKTESRKKDLYISFSNHILNEEDYININAKFSEEIKALKADCKSLEKKLKTKDDFLTGRIKWIEDLIKYGKVKKLEREVLLALVENIYVTHSKEVIVQFKNESMDDVQYRRHGMPTDEEFFGSIEEYMNYASL